MFMVSREARETEEVSSLLGSTSDDVGSETCLRRVFSLLLDSTKYSSTMGYFFFSHKDSDPDVTFFLYLEQKFNSNRT